MFTRYFTTAYGSPFDTVKWVRRTAKVADAGGKVRFHMEGVEVPEDWSQNATDIVASKYFRKAGVPVRISDEPWLGKLPSGEWRPDGHYFTDTGEVVTGSERSVKQVVHRMVSCWQYYGVKHGYFTKDSELYSVFYDEVVYMLLHQMAAPNSPQWFNTGLYTAYGIAGKPNGQWRADHETGEVVPCENTYEYPQAMACFIQSLRDDMVNEGGIFDLWTREARVFKFGSGSGTNMSALRAEGEPLSGGGTSSGLMSWLRIGDRAAGAIKSGGTVRRAALMRVLDLDHPDILDFIRWKSREELKVKAMVEGRKLLDGEDAEYAEEVDLDLDFSFNGEAYETVSGQNSNNSIRIPSRFFTALDAGGEWVTTYRTDGKPARAYLAADLWDEIGTAAWRCADPGVQFDDIIQDWHTTPSIGRINASNPCSEYLHVDDSGCNLASLNLVKFQNNDGSIDCTGLSFAASMWTLVLEITVSMAASPSKAIAENTWGLRNLGLGFANAGAMLMRAGIPYDSDEGRQMVAAAQAIIHGSAYRTSAEISKLLNQPFPAEDQCGDEWQRVVLNHYFAAVGQPERYSGLTVPAQALPEKLTPKIGLGVGDFIRSLWDDTVQRAMDSGIRNAQVTVIAPTGTIGLVMDCDTTGIEPDFSLVKFKKLSGGGYLKIANNSVRPALVKLGYSAEQVDEIMTYLLGTMSLDVPLPNEDGEYEDGKLFSDWLRERGFSDEKLREITDSLPGVFDIRFAFNAYVLGDDLLRRLGYEPEAAKASHEFDGLRALQLRPGIQIEELNRVICGAQTLEGAPHLREEHLPVFDCANPCGRTGTRFIHPEAHIRMLAAVQPFVSGGISKTVNCPQDTSKQECLRLYRLGHDMGVKCVALYRDGSKYSQPLNTSASSEGSEAAEVQAAGAAPVQSLQRRRLPETRPSVTHRFEVDGHKGYLTVGYYEDGRPGELFVTMSKEGSTLGGMMDTLASVFSTSLQYGVPLTDLLAKMRHQRFEPSGMTGSRQIPFASSLPDYIAHWMGTHHPGGIMLGYAGSAVCEPPLIEERQEEPVYTDSVRMVECPSCKTLFNKSSACAPCTNCGHHGGCGA